MKRLLTVLLAAATGLAFADGNNLYVGVDAGAGWNDVASPATSFRLDGGYNWNDYWAFEIGTTGITQSGGTPNQSMQYYDASIKGTLPLGDTLGLFAQVGGAYGSPGQIGSAYNGNVSATQAGWNFLTGVGVDLNLTRQVSLNLSDLYYYGANAPQGNTNVLLAGVQYKF